MTSHLQPYNFDEENVPHTASTYKTYDSSVALYSLNPADTLDPNSPDNPLNWSKTHKWINLGLVAAQATLSPICSTLLAVGAREVTEEFHVTNPNIAALPIALFVLGLGLGPLYLAPLSEIFGRRNVYLISFGIFCLLNVGCAMVKNMAGLIVLRFLAGLAGSAGPSLGGGTVGDMFRREERGGAQAVYGFGPTFGPAIGGLIGGYISQRAGWRWLMWVMVISSGLTTVVSIFFLRETYAPYIHSKKQGKWSATAKDGFKHTLLRPIRMLFLAPIVTTMSLYMAIIYGILYLHLTTIPLLFGPKPSFGLFTYKWTGGNDGLAYLGAGTGCYVSIIVCLFTLNRSYRWLCKRYKSEKPEFRMPFMQLGMFIIPIGLFLFGWSANAHLHFMIPLLGACIFAFGMLMTYICIQTYLVDAFQDYAASALAATIVLRSIFGAVFSIIGEDLYKHYGYGWGTSVLGFISCAALPIPFLFWRYGAALRAKPFLV
ncbi:major facilitator superfamily domain-containing protein [Crucibulum laeve]|uniref:Major facilitator superfamily domain-containing protein n=1 Tax=Crucibulum laeve TaxID=68775 RepID=A0A5C3LMH7_9AGAR|nr:major facilitator superfamily domain-containing protein [Crucibulum laeve]